MKGTFGVAVLAAALLLAAGASATPPPATNLNVTATFSNAVPQAGVSLGAANPVFCPPTPPPSGGCTATPPVQVRWGRPALSGGQRSGLGFGSTPATSVPLDTSFVVGTLTHFNFPITDSLSSVDLAVHLTAHTADGDLSFDLPFTLGIVETPNSEPCPFRAQPTDPVCPDAIDLPAGGVHVDLPTGSGTAHPHTYTLNVVGFTTSSTDLTHPVSRLITQENAATQGFLVASISRDNVAPVAADDTASTTSGGSTTIDAVANDTDADADALAPVIVTAPVHGTATVNPDGTITYTADSNFAGTDHISYAASDGFSQSAPADIAIAVADTTGPTITVPSGGVAAEATGPDGVAVTYAVSATDNVDGAIPVECRPPSGSTFSLGTHTVTCTATDAAGNTATQTFDVTVQDTTAPALAGVPSDRTAEATGPGGAPVTYTLPTATDAADPNPHVDCVPASGSTFHLGANTVTCTATDASGNSSSQTFTITVQDTTAPVVIVSSDLTVFSAGGSSIPVSFTASASDLVDGSLPASCTPASGATFPVGPTTVTCSATDAAGNTGSASFTVTVVPNRPPVCSAVSVQGLSGLWPVNHKLVLVSLTGATDPDGNSLSYRIDGVTQDEPVSGGFDAEPASGGSVWLRSERLGTGDGRVYTVAFTVTDQYGLSCSGTVDVTVAHDSAHAAVKSAGSYDSFGS